MSRVAERSVRQYTTRCRRLLSPADTPSVAGTVINNDAVDTRGAKLTRDRHRGETLGGEEAELTPQPAKRGWRTLELSRLDF